MSFSEFEIRRLEKLVGQFVQKHRPLPELRDQVDLAFRIKDQSVIIYEIREVWDQPGRKTEPLIAKASRDKSSGVWKIYWQRADMRWHRYEPTPETASIEEFLAVVDKDEYHCFWG